MANVEHLKVQRDLFEMFHDLDEDGSGYLSKDEFTDVLDDPNFVRQMKVLDIELEDLPDIFEILDDGDGQVSMEEFCYGLLRMQGKALNRDMLKAMKGMGRVKEGFQLMQEDFHVRSQDSFDWLEGTLDVMHEDFGEIMQMMGEVLSKLDYVGIRRTVKASTKDLQRAADPSLADIQKRERKEAKIARMKARQAKMKEFGYENTIPKEEEYDGKTRLKPMPSTWVLRHIEEQKEAQKQAMKALLTAETPEKSSGKAKKAVEEDEFDNLPELEKEFYETWSELNLTTPSPEALRNLADARLADGSPPPTFKKPTIHALPGCLLTFERGLEQPELPGSPKAKALEVTTAEMGTDTNEDSMLQALPAPQMEALPSSPALLALNSSAGAAPPGEEHPHHPNQVPRSRRSPPGVIDDEDDEETDAPETII
eukprot:gnl/TRDRNA2_/TRDRNA2_164099_c1_seq5.p1 gnl/TRDRNA2_/TRDRNA2_164099_c1~~gnl/TRDRNA2_/TRDRNA2_164099_c1_seq5.p1  ORF type:complete len:461 (+),score=143.69 gnl/TRDRNA2_/TRDRNA2_164099_c1_seq5:109-1383(+)